MRILNSIRNIAAGLGYETIKMVVSFATRTIFIYYLGKSYLGISGLFTSVISLLSLAELGIGAAIVFSLYAPLAQDDRPQVQALMDFYRKAYFLIGAIILVLGLALFPFIPYIIKGLSPDININLIYLLYLISAVSSYWFYAYRSSILTADQKQYASLMIHSVVIIAVNILQIVSLVMLKDFIIYLIIQIIGTLFANFLISAKVLKLYPYLRGKCINGLAKEHRNIILKNVYAVSLNRVALTVLSSSNYIIISACIGMDEVAVYSNYHVLIYFVTIFLGRVFGAFTASIGNLNAIENNEKMYHVFKCVNFIGFWFYGFCGICYWILVNPFIVLWIGEDYLFEGIIVVAITLNFVTSGFQHSVTLFRNACGLFWQVKYRSVVSAVLCIVLSLILVRYWGVLGVLISPSISRLLTTWWFEPWIVYKHVFKMPSISYYINYIKNFCIVVAAALLTQKLCYLCFGQTQSWFYLIGMIIICIIVPNLIFFLIYRKSEEFRYLYDTIKNLISSFIKKKNPVV